MRGALQGAHGTFYVLHPQGQCTRAFCSYPQLPGLLSPSLGALLVTATLLDVTPLWRSKVTMLISVKKPNQAQHCWGWACRVSGDSAKSTMGFNRQGCRIHSYDSYVQWGYVVDEREKRKENTHFCTPHQQGELDPYTTSYSLRPGVKGWQLLHFLTREHKELRRLEPHNPGGFNPQQCWNLLRDGCAGLGPQPFLCCSLPCSVSMRLQSSTLAWWCETPAAPSEHDARLRPWYYKWNVPAACLELKSLLSPPSNDETKRIQMAQPQAYQEQGPTLAGKSWLHASYMLPDFQRHYFNFATYFHYSLPAYSPSQLKCKQEILEAWVW